MMTIRKSTLIFFLHGFCLFAFVANALASGIIKAQWPEFFTWVFLPGFAAVAVTTLVSWKICRGCPLTRWENRARITEGKKPYNGSCMLRSLGLARWHGRPFYRWTSLGVHLALVGAMIYPVWVRFYG